MRLLVSAWTGEREQSELRKSAGRTSINTGLSLLVWVLSGQGVSPRKQAANRQRATWLSACRARILSYLVPLLANPLYFRLTCSPRFELERFWKRTDTFSPCFDNTDRGSFQWEAVTSILSPSTEILLFVAWLTGFSPDNSELRTWNTRFVIQGFINSKDLINPPRVWKYIRNLNRKSYSC